MYKLHQHCRACGYGISPNAPGIKVIQHTEKLKLAFDLGIHPLANDFRGDGEERSGFAPLQVMLCPRCSLAQLSVTVNPSVLYSNYSYVTSKSAMMREHFSNLWNSISESGAIKSLIEIGSNDGDLLGFACSKGATAVGIDPAENLVKIAREIHPEATSLCGLFGADIAATAKQSIPNPDVILARHVFCHIDDWKGFFKAIDLLAEKETRIVIEVPYAGKMLENLEFDTIYHEHLSYMTLKGMEAALDSTPFRIHDIKSFPIHGGTIAIIIRRRDSSATPVAEAVKMVESESIGWNEWVGFAWDSSRMIKDLARDVMANAAAGHVVCGFGASAKSTVWMRMCGFDRTAIKFITDTTPQKQGKFSPGTDVPIVDQGALLRELPKYAVVFAWNYLEEILKTNRRYTDLGGKFIVPSGNGIRVLP